MVSRRDFTRLGLLGLGAELVGCSYPRRQIQSRRDQAEITAQIMRGHEPSDQSSALVIWWEHGYLPEENEGILGLIQAWERDSGLRVALKFMPDQVMEQEFGRCLDQPERYPSPDLVFSVSFTSNLAPKLAWDGHLRDLSSVIEPLQSRFTPFALSQVRYRNRHRGDRRYYGVPIGQSDDYIHYWKSALTGIGRSPTDIPLNWQDFWSFWQSAQTEIHARQAVKPYGLGLCLSDNGFDTYTTLRLFLDAYQVEVVNSAGDLVLAEHDNRINFIQALYELTSFYTQGYIPPAAIEWSGSGNNTSFLEGSVIMTHNLTLSIPMTQKLEANAFNQDALQRYQQIGTMGRPHRPDGNPLQSRKLINQILAPEAGRHPEAAQDFLAYILRNNDLNRLIQGFKGRILPVMPELLDHAFWRDSRDAHISTAVKLLDIPCQWAYEVVNPAFSEVQRQQIWAKAIRRIVQDKSSVAMAVSWTIEQIREIYKASEVRI